ncbi:uncharacterized protein METZ01_LOCUS243490, partial [marine metagenome]
VLVVNLCDGIRPGLLAQVFVAATVDRNHFP